MSAIVKIVTADLDWITRRGLDEPIPYGTTIRGVMQFEAPAAVPAVEHVKAVGAAMIRPALGADAPWDHDPRALYPDSFLLGARPHAGYREEPGIPRFGADPSEEG